MKRRIALSYPINEDESDNTQSSPVRRYDWPAAFVNNSAIVDSRLCPVCATQLATHGLYRGAKSGWNFGCYASGVTSPFRNTHDVPLCENLTSSTKPEVHNVSQRRKITVRYLSRPFCHYRDYIFAVK